MSNTSPFGEHKENGAHLIMCKDGRSPVQEKIIQFVRNNLGEQPFLSAFWGGALEVVKLGPENFKLEFLDKAPKVIGEPKRFILINHCDCAGVASHFDDGSEPFSENEIKNHVQILNKAKEIISQAFPSAEILGFVQKENSFEQII